MEIVDEQGNLFGVVNIIDALVVLMILAVGIAGITLVFNDSSSETETETELVSTSVTLDIGSVSTGVAREIDIGDRYSSGDRSNLTITDVYLAPSDGAARVILQAKLQGEAQQESLTYAGSPVRLNRSIEVVTSDYAISGRIRDVDESDSLSRQQTSVVLTSTVDTDIANRITEGDTSRVAGRDSATVESVSIYATSNPEQKRVVAGVLLDTVKYGEKPQFGSVSIRRGTNLTYQAEDYQFRGIIDRIGATEPRGTQATRTVTLRMDEVRGYLAEVVEPGLSEQASNETIAQITDVDTKPSVIVQQDGSVVDHPFDKSVTITTELQVRETATGIRFKGEQIRPGQTVILDLGTITIEAAVVRIE